MNREIKFRFWNKIARRFQPASKYAIDGEGKLVAYDYEMHEYNDPVDFSKTIIVAQQYTGLKDKNGVEIYEGDILERIGDGSFCKIVISWDNCNCAFTMKNSFNLHGTGSPISDHNINISDWTYWVVCGNIFENPELLEA